MSTTTTPTPPAVTQLIAGAGVFLSPSLAWAQTAAPAATFDYTALAVSVIGGMFTVIGTVGVALINSRMKDKQAATVLDNALTNSLGAVQNAVDNGLAAHKLQVTIPGVSPTVAAGVQYVLDHAGDEAARLGVSPAAVADKIEARIGLAAIPAAPASPVASPLAVAASQPLSVGP